MRGAFRPFRGPTQHLDARRVVAFQPREQESGSAVVMLQQPRELLGCGRFPKRCLQYFRGRRNLAFVDWRHHHLPLRALVLVLVCLSEAEVVGQADAIAMSDRFHLVLAVGVERGKCQFRHVRA